MFGSDGVCCGLVWSNGVQWELVRYSNIMEQAGAKLCQAQEKLGLAKVSNTLKWSSISKVIEVVFH